MRGGKRPGAGRPRKADEDRIRDLCLSALERVYGSEAEAFEYIAKKSKESFPHLKLLFEYAYGKPKETRDVSIMAEQALFPDIPVYEFFGEEQRIE